MEFLCCWPAGEDEMSIFFDVTEDEMMRKEKGEMRLHSSLIEVMLSLNLRLVIHNTDLIFYAICNVLIHCY